MHSTCAAVPALPTASSRSSISGVATRVSARTLAYESSPRARARASSGSVPRACATRTRSRAAPGSSPTRQANQAAQERKPVFQPPRASNSRIRSRRCAVAASMCADSSAIIEAATAHLLDLIREFDARGGGLDVRRQLGDLITQLIQLGGRLQGGGNEIAELSAHIE